MVRREFEGNDGNMSFSAGPCAEASGRGIADGRTNGIAIRGFHFLAALTVGIAASIIMGPLVGVFTLADVFHVTVDGNVAGSVVDGAIALVPISILSLLLVTAFNLMQAGGFLAWLLEWLERRITHTVRGTELTI
ncbi:MAG: hypothetical protein IIC51_03415, partial [Planctomycetes bacterium]|nr:hypothetical protein [Planctomycetota bacterium]